MIAATSLGTPYVETDEKAMECSFRSLEFVNAMYVGEGAKIPMPKLSEVTHSGIRQVPGVITISCSTWMTTKMNGVVTDLFCTGVIDHPGYMFFKLGTKIPNLKQYNWSTGLIWKF